MKKFEKNKKLFTPGTIVYHVVNGYLAGAWGKYHSNYHVNTYVILGLRNDGYVDVIDLKKYQESTSISGSISYDSIYANEFENIYFSKEKAEKICAKFNTIVAKYQQCEKHRQNIKHYKITLTSSTTGQLPKDINSIMEMLRQKYQELNIEPREIKLTSKSINQLNVLEHTLELAQNSIIEQKIYTLPNVETQYVSRIPYTIEFELPIDEDSIKQSKVWVEARVQVEIGYGYITPTSMKHVFKHYQFYEKIKKE